MRTTRIGSSKSQNIKYTLWFFNQVSSTKRKVQGRCVALNRESNALSAAAEARPGRNDSGPFARPLRPEPRRRLGRPSSAHAPGDYGCPPAKHLPRTPPSPPTAPPFRSFPHLVASSEAHVLFSSRARPASGRRYRYRRSRTRPHRLLPPRRLLPLLGNSRQGQELEPPEPTSCIATSVSSTSRPSLV